MICDDSDGKTCQASIGGVEGVCHEGACFSLPTCQPIVAPVVFDISPPDNVEVPHELTLIATVTPGKELVTSSGAEPPKLTYTWYFGPSRSSASDSICEEREPHLTWCFNPIGTYSAKTIYGPGWTSSVGERASSVVKADPREFSKSFLVDESIPKLTITPAPFQAGTYFILTDMLVTEFGCRIQWSCC